MVGCYKTKSRPTARLKLSNEGTGMYSHLICNNSIYRPPAYLSHRTASPLSAIIGRGNACLQLASLIRTCAARKVQRREEGSNGVLEKIFLMTSINNPRSHATFEKLPRLIILPDVITRKW